MDPTEKFFRSIQKLAPELMPMLEFIGKLDKKHPASVDGEKVFFDDSEMLIVGMACYVYAKVGKE